MCLSGRVSVIFSAIFARGKKENGAGLERVEMDRKEERGSSGRVREDKEVSSTRSYNPTLAHIRI